jgi:hypothetical protein
MSDAVTPAVEQFTQLQRTLDEAMKGLRLPELVSHVAQLQKQFQIPDEVKGRIAEMVKAAQMRPLDLPQYELPRDLLPPSAASLASISARLTPPPNPAKSLYERLQLHIRQMEAALDEEHEIGAQFVNFASSTVHVQEIGYHSPDILIFSGLDENGEPVQLLQSVSQFNVLFKVIKKVDETPRRPIGFI